MQLTQPAAPITTHYPRMRRGKLPLIGACLVSLLTAQPGLADEPATDQPPTKAKAWDAAQTVALEGVKVTLSSPVLVARSSGYLWFPSLISLEGGTILAVGSNYADEHVSLSTATAAWSSDGGLTWSKTQAGRYGDINLRLPNGDQLLMPYYLRRDGQDMVADLQIAPRGKQELQLVENGVRVTGWPRPDRAFAPNLGVTGFVFNGQTVALKDGGWLATLYGWFEKDKRFSLVAAESTDGKQWKIRLTIAGPDCKLTGEEGPCEVAMARLKDGRILCVFRLASYVPYGQTFSEDEGKTWSEPVAMDGAFSVQPSLAVMKDGAVALSGGRIGVFCWLNLDGTGKGWQKIDIHSHHNACQEKLPHPELIDPKKPQTSAYTEIIPLDDKNLLMIYDRVANGWATIPKDSKETNSLWVVRLTVERQ